MRGDWQKQFPKVCAKSNRGSRHCPTGQQNIQSVTALNQILLAFIESILFPHTVAERLQIFADQFSIGENQTRLRGVKKNIFDYFQFVSAPNVVLIGKRDDLLIAKSNRLLKILR